MTVPSCGGVRRSEVISSLLRNPAYSGTFVYGRTRFQPRLLGGPCRKHPLPPEQWQFMVPDKYPAYINRATPTPRSRPYSATTTRSKPAPL